MSVARGRRSLQHTPRPAQERHEPSDPYNVTMSFERAKWIPVVLGVLWLGACAPSFRPALQPLQPAAAPVELRLADYWPRRLPTYDEFAMKEASDNGAPAQRYVRRVAVDSRREGLLSSGEAIDLAQCLTLQAEQPPAHPLTWPGAGVGLFLVFEPPLLEWPTRLTPLEVVEARSACTLHNRGGRRVVAGEAIRRICFEGFESVTVSGRPYERCARVRYDTEYRFPWGCWMSMTEQVWLALGVGEVRIFRRIHGFFFFLYLEAAFEMERVSHGVVTNPSASPTDAPPFSGTAWERCAVYLHRLFPRPELGGAIICIDPGR